MRDSGKFGLLPGKIPVGLRDLSYYVAGDLPKPPQRVSPPAVAPWGMLGNDRYGDCGVAGLAHVFMADAAITHENEASVSDQQTIDYYLKYTNGQDSGVVLSDFLSYVRSQKFYNRKVDAYAPVNVHDVPTLQTAVNLYGASYTGITVTASMQQAFEEHQPWTTSMLNEPIIGGHCVPIVGYDDQLLYLVTWGGIQAVTYSAWHQISTEAWAVVTGEFVARNGDGRGVSLSALRADLDRLA